MISLMVMRYSQFPGARPIHWVAGEVRKCERTMTVANAVAQAAGHRETKHDVGRAPRRIINRGARRQPIDSKMVGSLLTSRSSDSANGPPSPRLRRGRRNALELVGRQDRISPPFHGNLKEGRNPT